MQSQADLDNQSGSSTPVSAHPLSVRSVDLLKKLAKSVFVNEIWSKDASVGVKRISVKIRKYAEVEGAGH